MMVVAGASAAVLKMWGAGDGCGDGPGVADNMRCPNTRHRWHPDMCHERCRQSEVYILCMSRPYLLMPSPDSNRTKYEIVSCKLTFFRKY